MSKKVKPDELGKALEQELTVYSEEVNEGVAVAVKAALDKLVKLTKARAPKGRRGQFRRKIAALVERTKRATFGKWYVKDPDYRLTHLLVHGHLTVDGNRTDPDPFLADSLDEVLPEFERDVEEVLKNGK